MKAGKAIYVFRTTIANELLEYIREATIPKIAWDSPATLFRKKNDVIP